jgi:hypothetical protein
MQLVQLQQAHQKFKDRGIGIAAISYDSPAILSEFAQRQQITFPLLADPTSNIIRNFHVLNMDAKGMTAGMAHPGFFYLDVTGHIKEKFFEAAYTDRDTPNNVIAKLFPELTEQVERNVDAPHISLKLQQTDQVGIPGSRMSLIAEIRLAANLHVYAPGVTGYKPIELRLDLPPEIKAEPAVYPTPKILFLPAIHERVPVFEGRFRIEQDVTVKSDRPSLASLGPGKSISIRGELKYQACDEKICYLPTSVPVSWELHVVPLDLKRSPEAIQHR